ncbi:MAG: aminodeoxychorismate lyase [Gammaproteobacteria bacterium]
MTRVLVDGRAGGHVDCADRGLNYGDGLFETLAVRDGRARFFDWHCERLEAGARRLALPLPERDLLREEIARASPPGRGVVKLVVTRGSGPRGYRPPPEPRPRRIVTGSPWPERDPSCWTRGVRVRWCRTRLGRNPALAGIKHLNRLEQVLARAEWDDDSIAEGLMMDDRGQVIGGTQTNLFVAEDGGFATPALSECGVAGVMRRAFLGWAAEQGLAVSDRAVPAAELATSDSLLLTNSLVGAWPVREFDGRGLAIHRCAADFNAWLEKL